MYFFRSSMFPEEQMQRLQAYIFGRLPRSGALSDALSKDQLLRRWLLFRAVVAAPVPSHRELVGMFVWVCGCGWADFWIRDWFSVRLDVGGPSSRAFCP